MQTRADGIRSLDNVDFHTEILVVKTWRKEKDTNSYAELVGKYEVLCVFKQDCSFIECHSDTCSLIPVLCTIFDCN